MDRAPSLRTSLAGRPPNISPRTNMCERASTWVVVQAVHVEGEVVAGGLVAGDAVRVTGIARGQHVVLHRVGVLGRGLGGEVVGQADRLPRSDQGGGRVPGAHR